MGHHSWHYQRSPGANTEQQQQSEALGSASRTVVHFYFFIAPLGRPLPLHISIENISYFFLFGFMLWLFSWPTCITYCLSVLLLKSVLRFIFAYPSISYYGIIGLTKKVKEARRESAMALVIFYSAAVVASMYFFGL
jgi:hypothetical protein